MYVCVCVNYTNGICIYDIKYFGTFVCIVLRRAFSMFDSNKQGRIEKEKVRTILNTMVHSFDDNELDQRLETEDVDGNYNQKIP